MSGGHLSPGPASSCNNPQYPRSRTTADSSPKVNGTHSRGDQSVPDRTTIFAQCGVQRSSRTARWGSAARPAKRTPIIEQLGSRREWFEVEGSFIGPCNRAIRAQFNTGRLRATPLPAHRATMLALHTCTFVPISAVGESSFNLTAGPARGGRVAWPGQHQNLYRRSIPHVGSCSPY